MVTFWPAVCQVHETYIKKFSIDHPSALVKLVRGKKDAGDAAGESALVAFFRDRWAPFVIRARWAILATNTRCSRSSGSNALHLR